MTSRPYRPPRPVPPGYVVHRVGATWLVFHRRLEEELVHLRLADPDARTRLLGSGPRRGRGSTPSVPLESGGSLVLRRYRHGGLLARLTGPLLLGARRSFEELEVTVKAEAAGAPVPRVLCVVAWPRLGPLWSAAIGTREEDDCRDLLAALHARPLRRDRIELARAVGDAVRRLHDSGVQHGDLQIRNVLVSRGDPLRVVVIDLDRARTRIRGMDAGRRAANLGRFFRSVVKTGGWPELVGRRELAAFVGAYTAGDRALRRSLRRFVARERLKLALHRLGYRLTGPPPAQPVIAG